MANYWTVLGLPSPPTDIKAVKKAYARKLKITRPDDDPAGFMALREAFEVAKMEMRWAEEQRMEQNAETIGDTQIPTTENVNIIATEVPSENDSRTLHFSEVEEVPTPPQSEVEPKYPFFYHEIQAVLQDSEKRNDKEAWEDLIKRAQKSSIDEYIEFDAVLRGTLLEEFGYYDGEAVKHNRNRKPPFMTSFTSTYLFKEMEWHKLEDRHFYVQQELDWLKQDMDVMNINRTPRGEGYKVEKIDGSDETGPSVWMFIVGIVVGIQVLRLILNSIGDGGY